MFINCKDCFMFYLQRNLPAWERAARAGAGLLLACAVVWLHLAGLWFWVGLGAAMMMVLTGFAGFCPACAMVGRRVLENRRP